MKLQRIQTNFEIKSMQDDTGIFTGYGSVFGNRDSYGEVVVKGAFSKFLAANDPRSVKLLWQHNPDFPIGIFRQIAEDEKGLFMEGQLLVNDVRLARESYALAKAGAISGMSIGFMVNEGGSHIGQDGLKYLTDLDLWETSLVTFPANTLATVTSVKSIKQIKAEVKDARDFEKCLRELGISRGKAAALTGLAMKGLLNPRDSGEAELVSALRDLKQSIQSEVLEDDHRNRNSIIRS